jgi:hypothetical protein
LEPTSHPEAGFSPESILEGQLRQNLGRVVYSHKTHEKCGDLLIDKHGRIKFWQIVLSALTTAGFIVAIFGKTTESSIAGIVISTTLLVLNAYTKDYDLGKLAQRHKQTAAELWLVRERYFSLLTDLKSGALDIVAAAARRDELDESLHQVYAASPSTTEKAYRQAQKALKTSEDMTFSDAEIDAFLPVALRVSKP